MDPNNIYQNRDIATWTNIFTLSAEKGDKGWYYEVHDVPHGSVAHVWYDSPTLGMKRRLSVYTPAGYEDNPKTNYPVLSTSAAPPRSWTTSSPKARPSR